jgi:iron(III) transport system ATP-binding protein
VGPSGSGKTTLLRLLAGFEAPDTGSITLDGERLADAATAVPAHRRRVGVVMQDGALFPHLTVGDNIAFGIARAPDRVARVAGLLDTVGLDPAMAGRKPDQLSGGQQQRVALARALALRPRLMLLDEPFSALDTGLRVATRKAVAAILGEAGITTILVTHDQAEALSFADRIAVLRDGRLVQAGPPQEVYARPADAATAELLGDAVILPALIAGGRAECSLGPVAVADPAFSGPADIVLRPEQIRLVPSDAAGASAVVEDREFSGAWSTVTLRLRDGTRLTLRQAGIGVPAPGTPVAVALAGLAHRLPGALP